jgi:hypothetical protein
MLRELARETGAAALNFKTYCLRRKTIEDATSSNFQIYKKPDWFANMSGPDLSSVMLVNVRRFYAQVGVINLTTGEMEILDEYDSTKDSFPKSAPPKYSPPVFLDLFIEMLSDQQMQELSLAGSGAEKLADRLSQKFSTRVALRNTAPYVRDLLP